MRLYSRPALEADLVRLSDSERIPRAPLDCRASGAGGAVNVARRMFEAPGASRLVRLNARQRDRGGARPRVRASSSEGDTFAGGFTLIWSK